MVFLRDYFDCLEDRSAFDPILYPYDYRKFISSYRPKLRSKRRAFPGGRGWGGINFLVIDVFVISWSRCGAGFPFISWRTSTSFHCAPGEGNSPQRSVRIPPGKENDPWRPLPGRPIVEPPWYSAFHIEDEVGYVARPRIPGWQARRVYRWELTLTFTNPCRRWVT